MNPWGAIIAVVLLIGAYTFGRFDGSRIEQSKQAKAEEVARQLKEATQKSVAEAIAGMEVKNVTVKQKTETEIREVPVYRDCVVSDSVFALTNEAITGIGPTGRDLMPAAGPDGRKDLGGLREESSGSGNPIP